MATFLFYCMVYNPPAPTPIYDCQGITWKERHLLEINSEAFSGDFYAIRYIIGMLHSNDCVKCALQNCAPIRAA